MSDFDVVIVGYGPIGSFAAILLGHAGLRVAVVERSTEIYQLPRAVGIDGEAMRALQRIGMADVVDAIVQQPREGDRIDFVDSKHREYFGLEFPSRGFNGWRDIAMFDQPELEGVLRKQVERSDRIETFLGHEVEALDQTADQVTVRCLELETGQVRELRAPFAIACDGASSFVREALGIEWQSLGYDRDWLVLDIVQNDKADLPLTSMQVCDPERLATYICVKDPNRRWEFQLVEGETREEMLRPEKIEELLRPWLPPEHYEIRRAAVYQFHAATAGSWQRGRVFLAGDAAHQTPPFLGQGLNAGFRDAVNLGWKIPLVHRGVCDLRLLETYGEERDAHACDLVQWAVAVGQLMETLAAREAGDPDPHPDADQSSGYRQGRVVPPLRGGVLLESQINEVDVAGGLLRQPDVRGPDGRECRFDELIGGSFAVIARKDDALRLGPEARSVMKKLGASTLSLEKVEVVEGELDSLFAEHEAVILRPDRYVFGVVDQQWTLDAALVELGRKLQLNA